MYLGAFLNDQGLDTECHRFILLYKRSRLWIKMMKKKKKKSRLLWGKGISNL